LLVHMQVKAMQVLHDMGVETVVITSCVYGPPETITLVASRAPRGGEGGVTAERFKIVIPRIKDSFTGTGDLVRFSLYGVLSF
jgi:pyridoxal/pyridoxine/pyridoxamine kinase